MRIEIRKSGDHRCTVCGSYKLLYTPALNQHFERDLLEFFQQDIPRWRLLKKRRFAHFAREVERVTGELRDLTRLPLSDG